MCETPWRELVRIEPGLDRLLADVRKSDTGQGRFCAVSAWHGYGGRPGFKGRMYQLAGFGSSRPELRTMAAYDTALKKLYGSLPPCRGCACVSEEEVCCA